MKRIDHFILWVIILTFVLAGCEGETSPAVRSVENYLEALVNKEEAFMASYLCPAFEVEAFIEFDSFALVQTALEGLICSETGEEPGKVMVVCQGRIEATYGNELRSFDLSERIYTVVESEGGDWLVCGYTE
jgi:hypothetical protein